MGFYARDHLLKRIEASKHGVRTAARRRKFEVDLADAMASDLIESFRDQHRRAPGSVPRLSIALPSAGARLEIVTLVAEVEDAAEERLLDLIQRRLGDETWLRVKNALAEEVNGEPADPDGADLDPADDDDHPAQDIYTETDGEPVTPPPTSGAPEAGEAHAAPASGRADAPAVAPPPAAAGAPDTPAPERTEP